MRMRTWMVLGSATVLMAATPALRGGWAILTVHELPEQLVAGTPTTLTFSLRQHGEHLMAGRAPVVHIRSGGLLGERQRVEAERTRQPGVYRATFTPRGVGEAQVRVDTDFHGWTVDLLPIAVGTARGDRGRALFVAKGCIGCHTKSDDATLADYAEMRVGPDLTGRSYPTAWLVQKVTDPASIREGRAATGTVMPQLEVTAAEAMEIARYLNARSVASRD